MLENMVLTKTHTHDKQLLEYIVNFLKEIGINVIEEVLNDSCVLPGLKIQENSIRLDRQRLKYVGDILHEAGHLAVTPKDQRILIGTENIDSTWPSDGDEIAAILWSYAASCHLNLDLEIVFHPDGYKNESVWLIEQFNNKNYVGLPLLEWMSLCNKEEFPIMKMWLRQ